MHLCEYGCGQPAKYKNKSGKRMCCKYWQQCPKKREETSIISKKSHSSKEYKQKTRKNSIKQFENESQEKKEERINKIKKTCNSKEYIEKRKLLSLKLWNDENKRKQYVESIRNFHKDPEFRKNASKSAIRRFINEEEKDKIKRINKIKYGSQKYFENETDIQKKYRSYSKKRTIEKISKKYPIFAKEEEMRYEPGKEKERDIQVHCKNHLCKNSKEQGGWFTPTSRQIEQRLYGLDNNTSYFYCSNKCKSECDLFKLREDPYRLEEYKRYISEVYKETNKSLNKYRKKIKNIDLRGRNNRYDLDHKFSIYDGYIQQISPEIVGHWKNLEIIKTTKNRKKGKKSSVSLKKLLNEIKEL